MKKLSLFVVSHKEVNPENYPGRKIIYVGNNNFKVDNITTFKDNTGDNITEKNKYFCELTALYWIWKNYPDSEYYGLEHYRRSFYNIFLRKASIKSLYKKAKKVDFIHMQPWYHVCSVKEYSAKLHSIKMYEIMHDIFVKLYPEYLEDFEYRLNTHNARYCNIFICNKKLFNQYMQFMFDICFEFEKHIKELDIEYQPRIVGYVAELLFDTYIHHHNLKHLTKLVIVNEKKSWITY